MKSLLRMMFESHQGILIYPKVDSLTMTEVLSQLSADC